MIGGSALAAAVLFSTLGDRSEVIAVREDVARGQVLGEEDLVRKSVAGIDDAFGLDQLDRVIGSTARVDMVAGQVVTSSMITTDPIPAEGEASVGLSLDPSRAPSAGLQPGDTVDVIAVPAGAGEVSGAAVDAPRTLARDARVVGVDGSATDGGVVLVTVVVGESDAATIAAHSAAGLIAVIETAPPASGAGD